MTLKEIHDYIYSPNSPNIIPKAFLLPENEALMRDALEPFRDEEGFREKSFEEQKIHMRHLAQTTLNILGVTSKIEIQFCGCGSWGL